MKYLALLDRTIDKSAKTLLVGTLGTVIVLSLLGIVLRWFDIAFLWWEPAIRHLVFAGAFLGGILATGKKNHIGIDLVTRYLESADKPACLRWVERVVFTVSFLALLVLVKVSWDFVLLEAEYGREAFLGIHSRFLVAIIPAGACLIGFRFFYLLMASFCEES